MAVWRQYDLHPPHDLLAQLVARFGVDLVERAIRDVGRAGRLPSYRAHFDRFCVLREQSVRLLAEEDR